LLFSASFLVTESTFALNRVADSREITRSWSAI